MRSCGGTDEGSRTDVAGFSLVEVIIAMLILGFIAVALIPALWQGINLSSQQSTVATATRQLYALVEEARDSPTCGELAASAATKTFTDGADRGFSTTGSIGGCVACPAAPGITVALDLAATQGSHTLATVSALVFVQGAKAALPCP